MRVGVIGYLRPQGLGYDAVAIRAALRDAPGVELSFFPVEDLYSVNRRLKNHRVRPARTAREWRWPEAERRLDLRTWVEGLDAVFTLEVFSPRVTEIAKSAGARLLHVPNLEWISDREGWREELSSADLLVAKTRHTARTLTGFGLSNVTLVPWSVPVEPAPPRPTRPPVVFFHAAGMGGSIEAKNPEAVLSAFAAALGDDPAARLVVTLQVPARKRKVPLDLAPFAGLGNVEVVEGDLPREEWLDLARTADISVYPSRAEGFGLPILESLCLSVPVLTTDAPPMNEHIADGVNGVLVPGEASGRHRHVDLFEVDRAALSGAMRDLADPVRVDALKARAAEGLTERWDEFRRALRAAVR